MEAALLLGRFRKDRRDWNRFAVFSNRHKREIGDRRVMPLSGQRILRLNLDSNLERGFVRIIDRRLQDDNIAGPDRREEVEVIDRGGHADLSCVPLRANGSRQIDPGNELTTKNSPHRICMGWMDNVGHFNLGLFDRFWAHENYASITFPVGKEWTFLSLEFFARSDRIAWYIRDRILKEAIPL